MERFRTIRVIVRCQLADTDSAHLRLAHSAFEIAMPHVDANGIRLEYDTFGDRSGRPLVLIMGLGQQMILWDEAFCQQLADHGHFVVRFDNRDTGGSTSFSQKRAPSLLRVALGIWITRPVAPVYTLGEMADDLAGLLDALDIERAHLAGASMGGIIAQAFAVRHRERTVSLTSMMATTGNPWLPLPRLHAVRAALRRPPSERAAYIDYSVELWRAISSPGYPFRQEMVRARSQKAWERGPNPTGASRQLLAIVAAGDRRKELASIMAPTLVIHGRQDPLIRVEGGIETASVIPGAQLLTFEGMGHDIPYELWPDVIAAISSHTESADAGDREPAAL